MSAITKALAAKTAESWPTRRHISRTPVRDRRDAVRAGEGRTARLRRPRRRRAAMRARAPVADATSSAALPRARSRRAERRRSRNAGAALRERLVDGFDRPDDVEAQLRARSRLATREDRLAEVFQLAQ